MKKIIAFLLAVLCLLSGFSVSAAGVYNSVDSVIESGYIQSEKIGNIFSITDEVIKFTQEYENITKAKVEIQSSYQVFDESNNLVKEYPGRSFEISAGGAVAFEFVVDNPGKYGVYTLRVVSSISFNGETYTKTCEEGFSVCMDLKEENAEPNFGFAQHIISKGYGDADNTSKLMRNAGATWYREDCLTWSMVEKSKGVYTIPAGTKEKLLKIKNSGLKILCILNGTNGNLYNFPSNDESIDAFVAYCTFIAREFDGIVDHFEIWNEWNMKKETDTEGYYKRTDIYAKVLTKAYNAVKGVNENNTVIGCATAGIEDEWIDGVLTNLNGTKAMDAVSVHCYPWTAAGGVDVTQLVNDTADLKDVLKKHSLDIPIWVTEIGFSTFTGSSTWLDSCTNEQQLNSLVLVNALNKGYGLFDKLIQYSFHDRANLSAIESNWGLVNCWQRGYTDYPEAELTPYGAKPSYLGIVAMNYFIGGNTEFQEMTKGRLDRAYTFRFRNNNLRRNVMLCINGNLNRPTQKTVELDTNKIQVYDKYGNFVEELASDTGAFSIDISAEPMYLTWPIEVESDFINVEVDKNTRTVTISGVAEAPGDLVSVIVTSQSEEINEYNPERTLFVGQAKADENRKYSMSFVMNKSGGKFEVFANSKIRQAKQKANIVLAYSIPEIKVMQNGADIYSLNSLNVSNSVDVELRGFVDLTDEEPVLIIAQYSNGQLVSATFDNEAIGDCIDPGNEIKKSFNVQNGVDKIKIMYMNINNMKPFVTAYEIK